MTLLELLQGKTPQEKVRICYRVLEKLRLRHNEWGAKFRNGEITEVEWRAFLAIWEPRHKRVYQIVNAIKDNLDLFLIQNQESNMTLKEEGRALTVYDADIDIDNIG